MTTDEAPNRLGSDVTARLKAYARLRHESEELAKRVDEERQAISKLLWHGEAPGTSWKFAGIATVSVVNGRSSEKLDRAVLARAGVSAELLDEATVRTGGKPVLRIMVAAPEQEEGGSPEQEEGG